MYERMRNGWRMGAPFTVCGNGSTLEATERARRWLAAIVQWWPISSIADVGAGDLAWMKHMRWGMPMQYRAYDLIPRSQEIEFLDITKTSPPVVADAILCRSVLNHIQERIGEAIANIKTSGSKFLIATQFDAGGPQRTIQFARLDLRSFFGDYIEACPDTSEEGCKLALWRI